MLQNETFKLGRTCKTTNQSKTWFWLVNKRNRKAKKVLKKIVFRFSTGGRTTVLTDIEWDTNNSKKIQDLIVEFETLMEERHID